MCRNPVLKHFYKQLSCGLEKGHHNMISKVMTSPQPNNLPGEQTSRQAAKFYSTSDNDNNSPDQYMSDTARYLAKGINLNSTAAHVMANKYLASSITSKQDTDNPSQQMQPASNMASQLDPASQSTMNIPQPPEINPMQFQVPQQDLNQQDSNQQYQQFPGPLSVMANFGQQKPAGDGITSDGKMQFTIPEATFSTEYQQQGQDFSQPLQHLQAAMAIGPQVTQQGGSGFQVPFPPFQNSGPFQPQQGPPMPHLMANNPVVFPGQQVTNFGKPESAITFAHLTLDSYSSQNNTLFPGATTTSPAPFQGAPPPPFQ